MSSYHSRADIRRGPFVIRLPPDLRFRIGQRFAVNVRVPRRLRTRPNRPQDAADGGDDDDNTPDNDYGGDNPPGSGGVASKERQADDPNNSNEGNEIHEQEQQDASAENSTSEPASASDTNTSTVQCNIAKLPAEPAHVHLGLHGEILPLSIFADFGRGAYGWLRNECSRGGGQHSTPSPELCIAQLDDGQETAKAASSVVEEVQSDDSNTIVVEAVQIGQQEEQSLQCATIDTQQDIFIACTVSLPELDDSNIPNNTVQEELQTARQAPIPVEKEDGDSAWESMAETRSVDKAQIQVHEKKPKSGFRKSVRSMLHRLRKNLRPGKSDDLWR